MEIEISEGKLLICRTVGHEIVSRPMSWAQLSMALVLDIIP
jgi:hypothetical protein